MIEESGFPFWTARVGSLATGASCAAIGAAAILLVHASGDQWLAFVGSIFGAGATVAASFAVVDRTAKRDRLAAKKTVRRIAETLARETRFLQVIKLDLPHGENRDEYLAEAHALGEDWPKLSARIDAALIDIPALGLALRRSDAALKAQRPDLIAPVERFANLIEQSKGEFDKAIGERRDMIERLVDRECINVDVSPESLRLIAVAARELTLGLHSYRPG